MNNSTPGHKTLCAIVSFIFSFFITNVNAQVQTARNISMTSNSKGFYEYLPTGYSSGTQTYPMILFLHGMGELGNGVSDLPKVLNTGLPALIQKGKFPTSFTTTASGTQSFIVISPQFVAWPTPTDVNNILDYLIKNYRVNTSRIYITGLSMGGGDTWDFAGYNATSTKRAAAVVPIAGASASYVNVANNIADNGLAVWATHNDNDPTVPVSYTNNYIEEILARNPSAPVKKTIFSSTSHDAWTKTYDPAFTENGMNIYQWMLQYQRGIATPPANQAPKANAGADMAITLPINSVQLNGSGSSDPDGTIASYSWTKISGPAQSTISNAGIVNPVFSNLLAGTYTLRLTVTDDKGATGTDDIIITLTAASTTLPPAGTAKYIRVNIYGGTNPYTNGEWNNWNVGSQAATNISSGTFKYADGTASGVSASLSYSETVVDNGTGYSGSLAPAEVLRYTSYGTQNRTLTLNGLSTGKKYDIEFYASRGKNPGNSTLFIINGISQTVTSYNNLSQKASFTNLSPDAQGKITVAVNQEGSFNYLNGYTLTENADTTAIAPTTSTNIKVNIYGGTNPSTNSEWNNWNVGAQVATNISSGNLKYTDGTVSSVSAGLSYSETVVDNGTGYSGTLAPAEVLRYTSYGMQNRTLTLSGLSTGKKYDVELYASRNTNPGNSTLFIINGVSQTISSYNNLSQKASFTNLSPDAQGKIAVAINLASTYNYLNGFMITENAGTTVVAASPYTAIAADMTNEEVATGIVKVYPNPTTDHFNLQINNSYKGTINIFIIDINGTIRKEIRAYKDQDNLIQTLSLENNLRAGSYFIHIVMGTQTRTLRILKL
jgi:dienelactone hydrolase